MSVSRETGTPPDVVATLFPDLEAIYRYVDLLATAGVERGLIGPREVPRLWDRHVLNCAVVADAFEPGARIADVGSGAGLPGVVLALARPDLRVTLIEPLLRRATFLQEAVDVLGLAGVSVLRARAEDVVDAEGFDVVTSRAVAPLLKLAPWCLPLCRPGGEVFALKGSRAAAELAEADDVLTRYRVSSRRVEEFGTGVVEPPTTVIRLQSSGHLPRSTPTTSKKRRP